MEPEKAFKKVNSFKRMIIVGQPIKGMSFLGLIFIGPFNNDHEMAIFVEKHPEIKESYEFYTIQSPQDYEFLKDNS